MDLKGRNFLTLKDFTPEEITYLLDLSAELKEKEGWCADTGYAPWQERSTDL